ncbi:MAG: ComF family protein [Pseudomonadota bacterium]
MLLQSVVQAIYPAQCLACDALTDSDFGLCGPCRGDAHFIGGLVCDTCGTPLPGQDSGDAVQCDDCLQIARPWSRGRAVFVYEGVGRKLVLGLKHGDRTDLVPPMAQWMAARAKQIAEPGSVIVPVPLHWMRLVKRRYNQSALLAQQMGRVLSWPVCVDALLRRKRTKSLDGHDRAQRFAVLADAIAPNPKRMPDITGKSVVLVDDVMTSGATLAACADALQMAAAANVSIVTLARVAKDT